MSSNAVPTPGDTTPGTFLGREPLLWTNAVRAVLLLLIGLGIVDLNEVQIALVLGANEALLFLITRTQTTPNISVVERTMGTGDVVVAGPANEKVPEGAVIRRIGEKTQAVQGIATLESAVQPPQRLEIYVAADQMSYESVAPDGSTAYVEPEPELPEWPQTDEDNNG